MTKIVYVLMHIISPDKSIMVGLIKKKGPVFLIDKITVPGGKAEPGEDIFEASSRETREECGLIIEKNKWKLFDTIDTPEYIYHKLYTLTDKVIEAKKQEIEPIFVMDIRDHMQMAHELPHKYPHDFLENINKIFIDLKVKIKP